MIDIEAEPTKKQLNKKYNEIGSFYKMQKIKLVSLSRKKKNEFYRKYFYVILQVFFREIEQCMIFMHTSFFISHFFCVSFFLSPSSSTLASRLSAISVLHRSRKETKIEGGIDGNFYLVLMRCGVFEV